MKFLFQGLRENLLIPTTFRISKDSKNNCSISDLSFDGFNRTAVCNHTPPTERLKIFLVCFCFAIGSRWKAQMSHGFRYRMFLVIYSIKFLPFTGYVN